jgi:hypothetical protein
LLDPRAAGTLFEPAKALLLAPAKLGLTEPAAILFWAPTCAATLR